MRKGWFRYLAAGSGLAVVLTGNPTPVAAAGNAGLHLNKTVDPLQVTITPGIGITLGVDKSIAIPGDTLTYAAVVTNPISSFGMGGFINAQAVASTDANVSYYWDELQYCRQGCGNGAADPNWTALATFEAVQPGYVPETPPAVHTGMSFAATSVVRSGVTYPTSGDLILGTQISPSATAAWIYRSSVVLTPPQIALLSDPAQVKAIRNVLHFEVTERNTSAAQPYTDPEAFANPFTSTSNPGAITNITVTFTMPDGSAVAVGPTQVPVLATLNPGGSVTVTAQYKVPVVAARGSGETEAHYVARLQAIDGSLLTATAVAAGSGFSGPVYATSAPVTTQQNVPIVTIAKSGPTVVDAGATETNPLTLVDGGGATAASLTVIDAVPGGGAGTVSGTPSSLASGATGSATATYAVPISQAAGDLTDTAVVSWTDANGNVYGPLTSSFTTTVHNVLFGAKLTLAPTNAGPNLPGTTQTLVATLLDKNGTAIPNQVVNFTVTGANPRTGTGTTDASGNASFTYTGTNAGSDVVQAKVTAPGVTLTSNTSNISWGKPLQPVVTSVATGNFFPNPNNSCFFNPTGAPAFGQQFPDILFNPPASAVPHDVSSVTTNTRPFTDLTVDVNGNYNGQIVAQGSGQQAGVGSLTNFYAYFNGNFVVNQPGDVTFTILHDDGYILGVGNGATRVSGDLNNPPTNGLTPFNSYGVVAAWDQTGNGQPGTATVHFPAAGSYPYELDYTECGGGGPLYLVLETANFIAQTDPLSIYVGYADGLRGGSVFPFPWQGSPGVTFVGGCTPDAGTIRFDNSGATDITLDNVTVDLGSFSGAPHFDIWGPNPLVVPAHQILILTQTGCFNFDTSDFSGAGCGGNNGVLPLVNVTRAGATKTYTDTNQVLNTRGFDLACQGNESISWQRIAGTANAINVPLPPAIGLNLTPFNVPNATQGQSLTFAVAAMDSVGNPIANLPVDLHVRGVNAQILSGTTLASGLATFTYTGLATGSDTLQASAVSGGLQALSNEGTVRWTAPGGTNNPLGPSITSPTPADGSVVTKPVAVDATIAPPAGHPITSWRVFYQAVSGGPQVVIGSGSGAPPSPLGVTFDPTLLANGAYTITFEATADNGATQDVSTGITVLGGLKIGRYTTSFTDLSVPVNGFQMQVLRTYDSTDASTGDFGVGWRVDVSNFRVSPNHILGAGGWTQYNKSCVLGLCFTAFKNSAPRYVVIAFPDQHTEIFDFVPDGGTNIFWSCTPVFTARASVGTFSTLVPLDDTGCSYTGDGNIYGASGVYNPQRFQLTTRDGRVFVLDHTLGLVSMTDRNGNRLAVDATGVHASNGQSITFTRDGSGRITQVTGPAGQSRTYTYSAAGDLASSTDSLGSVNTYTYDATHHLLKVTGPQGALQTEVYDSSGRLTSVTDATGHTTQIQNDVGAQTVTYIDPIGATTTLATANDRGDIVRMDAISGGKTLTARFTYDTVGHVTQKTDPLGRSVSAVYDAQGDLVRYTDGLGNATQVSYDDHGQPTSILAPDGTTITNASYDANGNPVTILGPGGAVTHTTYNSGGQPLARTDAAGNVVGFTYDLTGRLATLSDSTGKSTTFAYDAGNRMVSVTDPIGNVAAFTYDAADNVTRITDGRGNAESFTYNAFGHITSATDPLGRAASVTYDAAGHLTKSIDRSGHATTYTYDADGNMTRTDYAGGEFLAYTFDGFGRPVIIANGSATINNVYDAAGELVNSTTHAVPFGSATITYTYDAAGNRLSAAGPDGTTSYVYDTRARLVRVTDPTGGAFNIQHDAASRVTGMTRPNGVNDSYSYDVNGKLVAITSNLGASTVQALTQTIDANGRVASRTDATGTATFTHDADGRLIGASGPGSVSQAYGYDAVGNRTSGPVASNASTYDAGNELTSDAAFTYTYDAEGRRVAKVDRVSGAITRYVYNGRNELITIQHPDGTSTNYTYDPLGRRLSVSSGASTTAYAYDGLNIRIEYTGAGVIAASYVGTITPDQPLEMTRGSSNFYYLQGFQRSVSGLTDGAGAKAASYAYDAFGVPTSPASGGPNPFTYTGREYDPKSGLYYNRARYYEPTTGSFITQDPIGGGNPYTYAAGDPVDYTDPSGALLAELGTLLTQVSAKYAAQLRVFGCGLAILSSAIEVGLNFAAHTPATADLVALLVGVVAGCALGALGAGAKLGAALFKFPFIGGVIAGVADMLIQLVCASQSGNWDKFNPWHAVAVGLGAYAIASSAAILGGLLPEAAPAVSKFEMAVGTALLSGDAAGALDLASSGGACA